MHRPYLSGLLLMNKILLPVVLLVSACGFHLKGYSAYDVLPQTEWSVQGRELQQPLEEALRRASGKPVDANQSGAVLRVLSVETRKDIYTITRAAKLNEYLLSMRVSAQAYRNGQAWGAPMQVDIRRTLPYADGMALGKQEEEQTIWREIQQDAADQLVRRLGFLPDAP